MRTVTAQSIFEAVLKKLGIDPIGDTVDHDIARAISVYMTTRCADAWGMWDWPELTRTEERAYRQLWSDIVQYRRSNVDGVPDEFYYQANELYYQVKTAPATDPPIGTLPTNTTYFSQLTPVSQYIERDQPLQNPMGIVIEVYQSDPSATSCSADITLPFRPSERGISICGGPATTVFVQYVLPMSEFTFVPFIADKTYSTGNLVFYLADGNCYKCLQSVTGKLPIDKNFFALQPVPEIFEPYLKYIVYADCLKEMPVAPGYDEAGKRNKITQAESEANEALYVEIDNLLRQGQKHHWMQQVYPLQTWKWIENGTVLVPGP